MSQQDYSSLASTFESYMSAHQPEGTPNSLYVPMRYINQLGGKRIRPVLLLMAYNLWHEDITPALPAALAIEYFHNFSLMHDDIMDEAELRRGSESVHIRYGRNSAILSGDAMLIRCFELLLEAGRKNNFGAAMCSLMASAAITICEGQQMDMDFEKMESPAEQEYIEMIRKKTACLIGTSLRIGALLGDASVHDSEALYEFGEKMGIAFQIQDDLLDVFGDARVTGKQQGGDILRGKKNFLYVHTLASLTGEKREEFVEVYEQAFRGQNIVPVLNIYQRFDVVSYASGLQSSYFEEARKYLNSLHSVNSEMLESFVKEVMKRDH